LALSTQKSRSLGYQGAEQIEQVQAWWARYSKIVLGTLAAVVVVVAALVFTQRTRAVQEGAAAGKLAEASVYYWQQDYPRCLELAKQIVTQYPSTPSGLEAHRLVADASFWNGDFKNAITEYRKYLEHMKQPVFANAARRSLAYALESDGQRLEAAKEYEGLVGKFDRNSSAEFLVAAARCYRGMNRPADALERLKRVDLEFGETSYANQARLEMGELAAATGTR
jgi:tetratricopeptide (TPR) repeat protein